MDYNQAGITEIRFNSWSCIYLSFARWPHLHIQLYPQGLSLVFTGLPLVQQLPALHLQLQTECPPLLHQLLGLPLVRPGLSLALLGLHVKLRSDGPQLVVPGLELGAAPLQLGRGLTQLLGQVQLRASGIFGRGGGGRR